MIIISNNNLISDSKNPVDSLPVIIDSLAPTNSTKKIRHALKNLCYYPPTTQAISPLIELFTKEIKERSKIFYLVCYNMINHARLAQPSLNHLATLITKEFDIQKKQPKGLPDLFRVFFYICFYTQQNNILLDTIIKLCENATKIYSEEKKKNKKNKKPSQYNQLFLEMIRLFPSLPDFDNSVNYLFQNEKNIINGLIDIYSNQCNTTKLSILQFLGMVKNIPMALIDLIKNDDNVINGSFVMNYIVNNKEIFGDLINKILASDNSKQLSLLQYKMTYMYGTSQDLFNSLVRTVQPSASYFFTLLLYLEKSPRVKVPDDLLKMLYSICESSNIQVAVQAFMCICLLTDELDWLEITFINLIEKLTFAEKCSFSSFCLKSWSKSINFAETNLPFIKRLFSILMYQYGETLNHLDFIDFCNKFVENNSDELIQILYNTLEKLPSSETVIYIFFGASIARKFCKPEYFEKFLSLSNEYMQTAGYSMKFIYKMTITNPPQE